METPQQNIYIPKTAFPLSDEFFKQQIRLGVQGFGGTGKNWSILGSPSNKQKGFPNCIILNLDRGCGSHAGCNWIYQVPIFKLCKKEDTKDYIIRWLNNEAYKLTEDQTLIMDSLSDLDRIYHIWYDTYGKIQNISSSSGKFNDFAEWKIKNQWFAELHNIFKGLRCNVVMLCHESERPDKPTTPGQPGAYTGKIRPILSGQFGDSIVKEYTDWFRMHCGAKNKDPKDEALVNWRMTKVEYLDMHKMFEGDTIYFWQTKGDDNFNAKASSLINPPTFIPATYETFLKYTRQSTTITK